MRIIFAPVVKFAVTVTQTSKSVVSRVSKPVDCGQTNARRLGSRRHGRFGNLRYIFSRAALGLTLIYLAGCAAGPNYKAPKTTAPAAFGNGSQTNYSTDATVAAWWQGFNDAKLNDLVERALKDNYDLRIATAHLREARALRRQSQFDLLPTVNGDASYADTETSRVALQGAPNIDRQRELYDAGFDATWELDLFGHVRRSVQAAKAETQAAEATRRDVLVSLISEVARNYFELRGAQHELQVATTSSENQRETLRITDQRLEAGRGMQLDVDRARAQLNSALAVIPPLETRVAKAIHRLSVLVGRQPTALQQDLQEAAPMPGFPNVVTIGSPADLLRRRSDLRAAEHELAAATARIGIATADLFPRVTFNGRIGLEASTFTGMGKGGSDTWSFGPSIKWAALDYGHVRARMKASDAQAQAALATYEKTVLTVLEETENALVDFGRQQVRRDYLSESVKSSESAVKLAHDRFDNGATDFLTVLEAERALLDAKNQLAQSQTQTATALVAVYKALGGGWEKR